MEKKPGFVYLISAGEDLYKVGFTTKDNVKARLAELQTGSPLELTLLAYISTDRPRLLEKAIHSELYAFRTRHNGEWHRICTNDLSRLRKWFSF